MNKTDQFSAEDVQLARFAKALGHPARVAIVRLLAERKSCICGDLVSELPLAQATVSQHLKELKDAGLIIGEISGPKVCYCLDPQQWEKIASRFSEFSVATAACCNSCDDC